MVTKDPTHIKNFKQLVKAEPEISFLGDIEKEMYGLNDRSTAIMMATVLDDSLEKLLKTLMRSDLNSNEIKLICGSDRGVFGTFSSKISGCYAFKLIGKITRDDLNIIREIRNGFAHSKNSIKFLDPETVDICSKLKIPDLSTTAGIPYSYVEFCKENGISGFADINNSKTRFVTACHSIAYRIWVAQGNEDNVYTTKLGEDILP